MSFFDLLSFHKLNNQDGAELLAEQVTTSAGTVSRKIWMQVYSVENGEENAIAIDALANPALTTLYDGTWIALDAEQMAKGNGQQLVLHNLPAGKGTTYSFKVFANYNVTPDSVRRMQDVWISEIIRVRRLPLPDWDMATMRWNLPHRIRRHP